MRGVERIAFLIGVYVIFQYRIRESSENFDQPWKISTILNERAYRSSKMRNTTRAFASRSMRRWIASSATGCSQTGDTRTGTRSRYRLGAGSSRGSRRVSSSRRRRSCGSVHDYVRRVSAIGSLPVATERAHPSGGRGSQRKRRC
jgi:hypothetical protein